MPEVWTPLLIGGVGVAIVLYGFSKTAMPVAAQALSIVDSVIEGYPHQVGINVSAQSNVFMQDVYFRHLGVSAVLPNDRHLATQVGASGWARCGAEGAAR